MRYVILSLMIVLSGCSSLAFTRAGHPYDGTGHALSAVACANHHSRTDLSGRKQESLKLLDTTFVAFTGVVDTVFSAATDTLRAPFDILRESEARPDWDTVNHWKVGDCENYRIFIDQLP